MAQMPTVTSHGIRPAFTPAILPRVADPMPTDVPKRAGATASAEGADAAAKGFMDLSAEFRGCAIFRPDELLAASGNGRRWLEAGQSLLGAADRAAGSPATHAHVATEDGETFALRSGGVAMVAVTDRFMLASLVFADMRAALRETARGAPAVTAEAA